jgi:hypothetical protein
MRLQAPLGCTAASVSGANVAIVDGVADVPDHVAAVLIESHGFVVAPETPAVAPTPQPDAPKGKSGKSAPSLDV